MRVVAGYQKRAPPPWERIDAISTPEEKVDVWRKNTAQTERRNPHRSGESGRTAEGSEGRRRAGAALALSLSRTLLPVLARTRRRGPPDFGGLIHIKAPQHIASIIVGAGTEERRNDHGSYDSFVERRLSAHGAGNRRSLHECGAGKCRGLLQDRRRAERLCSASGCSRTGLLQDPGCAKRLRYALARSRVGRMVPLRRRGYEQRNGRIRQVGRYWRIRSTRTGRSHSAGDPGTPMPALHCGSRFGMRRRPICWLWGEHSGGPFTEQRQCCYGGGPPVNAEGHAVSSK